MFILHNSFKIFLTLFIQVVSLVAPLVMNDLIAYHLKSLLSHTDATGVVRHAGEEWLISCQDARDWIVDVTEELVP